MAGSLTASTQAELEQISHAIHDMWFDVGEVTLSQDGVLSIALSDDGTDRKLFGVIRLGNLPPRRLAKLEIGSVASYILVESEGIGRYDINQIVFEAAAMSLDLCCNIPLEFRVVVTRLDVHLSEPIEIRTSTGE